MKTKMNLENYGVAEMTTREMETTRGGIYGLILGYALGLSIYNLFKK